MNIQDIDSKLIPEIEAMKEELGLSCIYARVDTKFLPDPEWVLAVTIILGEYKQKTVMFFDFIRDNDYDVVLNSLKKTLKINTENLKSKIIKGENNHE